MDVNSALHAFHFLQPAWLWALPLLWLLIAWHAWRQRRDGGWSSVIDAELLPALQLQQQGQGGSPWWLLLLLWTLVPVALAGPAWQREEVPAFRAPDDWVLLMDLSPSMAAADMPPDRAARARYAIEDILNAAKDARVALIAFAGEAHVVAPLTSDVATVRALLPPLSPDIMPESGDQLAPALDEASKLLHAAAAQHGKIIVLTDGIADPSQALQAAQHLKQQGIVLNVVGIGTAEGAPVPGKNGFAQDAQGHNLLSKLPVDQLQRVASAGGGAYVPVSQFDALIQHLQDAHAYERDQQVATKLHLNAWRNGGIWLLPPILLFAALLARRGWV